MIQEELEKIKKQAEQIKSNLDVLSSAQSAGMSITPQTSISDAQKFLDNRKTSSSFDLTGGIDLNKILGSSLLDSIDINSLLKSLSQPAKTLQKQSEAVKQSLLTGKQQAIDLAKSSMETEQQKLLSAVGLKTGVGSLVLEGIADFQRKNAIALANLASQYDQAIANLDLQTAQNIRNEITNLINLTAQLDTMMYNRRLSGLATAMQIGTQQASQLTEIVSNMLSDQNVKSIDQLPEKTKQIIEPLLNKIDDLSFLPRGTTKMKFDSILASEPKLQDPKIITTSGGGIYLFGLKRNKVVFEQLKPESRGIGGSSKISFPDIQTLMLSDLNELTTPKQQTITKNKQTPEQSEQLGFGLFSQKEGTSGVTTPQFILQGQIKTTPETTKSTIESITPKFIPADMSSFLDTAQTLANRTILRLSNAGYNISISDKEKIYNEAVKILASQGMLPAKKEVDDKSLLILLARKGEISLPDNFDIRAPKIDKLSPKDQQIFYNYKEHYNKLKETLNKILYGNIQTGLNINIPLLQNYYQPEGGQVIDISQ